MPVIFHWTPLNPYDKLVGLSGLCVFHWHWAPIRIWGLSKEGNTFKCWMWAEVEDTTYYFKYRFVPWDIIGWHRALMIKTKINVSSCTSFAKLRCVFCWSSCGCCLVAVAGVFASIVWLSLFNFHPGGSFIRVGTCLILCIQIGKHRYSSGWSPGIMISTVDKIMQSPIWGSPTGTEHCSEGCFIF